MSVNEKKRSAPTRGGFWFVVWGLSPAIILAVAGLLSNSNAILLDFGAFPSAHLGALLAAAFLVLYPWSLWLLPGDAESTFAHYFGATLTSILAVLVNVILVLAGCSDLNPIGPAV